MLLKINLKRYLPILAIMAFSQSIWAQDVDFLEGKQSKTEQIDKARNLLIDYIVNDNTKEIRATYNFLIGLEDENYVALYPIEKWMIDYHLADFHEILKDLYLVGESDFKAAQAYRTFPSEDYLTSMLTKSIQKKDDGITATIKDSSVPSIEKDFLLLLFHFLQADDYFSISQEMLNEEASIFLSDHPNSPYNYFIKEYIHFELKKSDWAIGVEYFGGYGILTQQLNEDFGNNFLLGFSFDLLYKKFYFSPRFQFGTSKITTEKTINKQLWPEGSSANVGVIEGALGYHLMPMENHFNCSPFIGMAVMNIAPNNVTLEDYPYLEDAELDFTTNYTIGAQLQYTFSTVEAPNYFNPNSKYPQLYSWFIRLRYQYNMPQFDKKYAFANGNYHCITLGIGFINRKINREKK